MRLRDLVRGFEIAPRDPPSRSVWRAPSGRSVSTAVDAPASRAPSSAFSRKRGGAFVLENAQLERRARDRDPLRLVVMELLVAVIMPVAMSVAVA